MQEIDSKTVLRELQPRIEEIKHETEPSKKSALIQKVVDDYSEHAASLYFLAWSLKKLVLPALTTEITSAVIWAEALGDGATKLDKYPVEFRENIGFISELVRAGIVFSELPQDLQNNEQIAISLLEGYYQRELPFSHFDAKTKFELPAHFLNDRSFLIKAASVYPDITYFISKNTLENRDFLLAISKAHRYALQGIVATHEEKHVSPAECERRFEILLAKLEK